MLNKTKILILGNINSIHLQKWIVGLNNDFEISVFSLSKITQDSDLTRSILSSNNVVVRKQDSLLKSKFAYLLSIFRLYKLYRTFKPDIVHAHYATSYGLLGRLLFPKFFFISVWGSDIFEFPKKSLIHSKLIGFILKGAHKIFSTSAIMASEIKKYTHKDVQIIPFGINVNLFKPLEKVEKDNLFVVGTVKSLENIYGIDRLIKSFKIFNKLYPNSICEIYGVGSEKQNLEKLVIEQGVSDNVFFKGFVNNIDVPQVLNSFDIFCAFSRNESFGVAVIEASSVGIPVLVTNVGGLPEVVQDQITGFVLFEDDINSMAEKMVYLAENLECRLEMGRKGREFVKNNFEIENCLNLMIKEYKQIFK